MHPELLCADQTPCLQGDRMSPPFFVRWVRHRSTNVILQYPSTKHTMVSPVVNKPAQQLHHMLCFLRLNESPAHCIAPGVSLPFSPFMHILWEVQKSAAESRKRCSEGFLSYTVKNFLFYLIPELVLLIKYKLILVLHD